MTGPVWAQESPRAVYLHIPFCTNKCFYCDFNSYVSEGQPIDAYLDAIAAEMKRTVEAVPPGTIDTIFVGGGTPTVLTPLQLERFLRDVRAFFPDRAATVEWTVEANPGTTDRDKLAVMRAGGVNRISFGAQSFDTAELERIGRIHRVQDVFDSIAGARAEGFDHLSIDLMFGLPGQSPERFQHSVDTAIGLGLPHYSVYHLKIEEHTLFHTLYERGELPLPEEEAETAMFGWLMDRMANAGYEQYEISNFARPGHGSRHNMTYWRNEPYYGIGAGAHGYVYGKRHWNIKGVQGYIDACRNGLPAAEVNPVSRSEAMEDFMMVGLRMLSGVRSSDFIRQFGITLEEVFAPVLAKLESDGLIEKIPAGIPALSGAPAGRTNTNTENLSGYRLSDKGIWLGNEAFGAFLGAAREG